MSAILPKPLWLRLLTSKDAWVTIAPTIYAPAAFFEETQASSWAAIVIHETVHLTRQTAMGRGKWLWSYFTDRDFRLKEECLGIAAELRAMTDPSKKAMTVKWYAEALAGIDYLWAAKSEDHASIAIAWFLTH